jgi:periplasmic divalent cation tolerance protein
MVEAAIRSEHTYSNPEIIEIGIEKGAQAYLDWILSVTKGA